MIVFREQLQGWLLREILVSEVTPSKHLFRSAVIYLQPVVPQCWFEIRVCVRVPSTVHPVTYVTAELREMILTSRARRLTFP